MTAKTRKKKKALKKTKIAPRAHENAAPGINAAFVTAAVVAAGIFMFLMAAGVLALMKKTKENTYKPVTETAAVMKAEAAATPVVTLSLPARTRPAYVIPEKFKYLFADVEDRGKMPKIHLEEAKVLYDSGKAVFIDARGKYMYNTAHIRGAVLLPAGSELKEFKKYEDIFKGKVLVPYCHGVGCHLADKVAAVLYELGYRKIAIFFGGWNEWTEAKYPVAEFVVPDQFKHLFVEAVSKDSPRDCVVAEVKFLYDTAMAHIVDVEPSDIYEKTHIDRAATLPYDKLETLLPQYIEIIKEKPIVLYDHGNAEKARKVAAAVYEAGQKKVMIFSGGYSAWKSAGHPVFESVTAGRQ